MHEKRKALALLFVAILCISCGSMFVRVGDWPPVLAALARCLVASVFYFGLNSVRRSEPGTAPKWVTMVAGIALALHLWAWIASVGLTSVRNSALLVNSTPVWVLLIDLALRNLSDVRRILLPVILSGLGYGVVSLGDSGAGSSVLGDMLALSGGLLLAVFIVAGREARRTLSVTQYAQRAYFWAALLLLVPALIQRPEPSLEPLRVGAVLAMCVFSQIIGHTLVANALGRVSAGAVALILLLEPVLASIYAWPLFGEKPTLNFLIGGTLVLIAVGLVAYGQARQTESALG